MQKYRKYIVVIFLVFSSLYIRFIIFDPINKAIEKQEVATK